MFTYICICVSVCRCLWRSEMLDPPGAGVTGSCKPPNMGVGAELKSSMQEQSVFEPLSHFSIPHFFFSFLRLGSLYSRLALYLPCRPGWSLCLCLLSAMTKGVLHHNGFNNSFLNENIFSHSPPYNINLPNYIPFSLDFFQMLSNSESEAIGYTLLWVQLL